MELPVPTEVPPQELVNHCVIAPVPIKPPLTVSVVLLPLQMVVEPVTPVGSVERVLTVTVTLAQVVVLQGPSARTKYVVVAVGNTVTEVPESKAVPPQVPEYHCHVAPLPNEPPATVKVVLPPLQMVVVPVIPVGAVEKVLTVTVTLAAVVVLQSPFATT